MITQHTDDGRERARHHSDADRDLPAGSAMCTRLLINSASSADKERQEEGKD